ncbi:MAG: hypothetical protein JSS83_16080 [Cyanobacteria bacterium SZAS LIN-3]|nr:hypothetical protein [Cyanobacteria bacterium SZAS LIN-3]
MHATSNIGLAHCRLLSFGLTCLLVWHLPAWAQPLQGGVEERAEIGPVAPPLQAGATFDERNLPALHTTRGWYMVPNWFAGLWHRETQTDKVGLFRTVTHASRRDRMRGYQIDRKGRIWQAHDEPNVVVVDTGRSLDYILDRVLQPLTVSDDVVVIRFIGSDIVVDKGSRKIIRSGQREEVQEIKPGPNNTLRCHSKLTRFDQNGNRLNTISGGWEEYLLRPFQPLDFYEGRNYFQDFCQYLENTNQADAIPDRRPAFGPPQR